MSRPSPEPSPAAKVQAALDELVAQRRREREKPSAPASPPPAPLPAERRPMARWLFIGLLAATVHAGGIYWYVRSEPPPSDSALVLAPSLDQSPAERSTSARPNPGPPHSPDDVAPASTARTFQPSFRPAGNPAQVGVIQHGDKVVVIPSSTPSSRPAPARTVIATPVAAAAPAVPNQGPAPARSLGKREHVAAAKEFAYHHFRYNYKIGSANYAVTSQAIRITKTEEIAGWNRYRSVGEVGLEYYDNSGFRRSTRRFEVITEEKDGAAQGLEITVK